MTDGVSGNGSFSFTDAAQASAVRRSLGTPDRSFLHTDAVQWQGQVATIQFAREVENWVVPSGLAELRALAAQAVSGAVAVETKALRQRYDFAAGGLVACQRLDRPLLDGDGPIIARIQHPVSAFAVAVSASGALVALGGGETAVPLYFDIVRGDDPLDAYAHLADVTVWECATGRQVARLRGLHGEVAALVFSKDERQLTGASTRAQRCTWDLATGALVREHPARKTRPFLTLTTVGTDPSVEPVLLATPRKGHVAGRLLAPDGRRTVQATAAGIVTTWQPSRKPLATLALADYGLSLAHCLCWSADSRAVGIVGNDWCGIWFPETGYFAAQSDTHERPLSSAAFLPGIATVVYAAGQTNLHLLTLPDVANEAMLTEWEQFKQRIDREPPVPSGSPRPDWRWGETVYGYEGVLIENTQLLWYSHSHNPHHGGGAHTQSFDDFLDSGPGTNLPTEAAHILPDLYRAVKLAQMVAARS